MRGMMVFLAATALCSGTVQAAELLLASKVDAVTVFPDSAMVSRKGEASLPAGETTLILKGLPAGVDPSSIRVEAQGERGLSIGAVETRAAPADLSATTENAARIKQLRAELSGVQGRIEAGEAQKRAIDQMTRIAAKSAGSGEKGLDIQAAKAAWTAVGEAMAEINDKLRGLRAQAGEIETSIRAIEAAEGRGRPQGAPRLDLAVGVDAASATKASFTISYRLREARWQPVYDAELATTGPKPRLTLVRRADITQRSGEDWSDAVLTLSTARVARGSTAPEIQPQTVTLLDPAYYEMRSRAAAERDASRNEAAKRMAPSAAPMVGAVAPAPEMVPAEEREATLQAGPYAASFAVPGRLTVTGDGARRSVRLASREIEPELTVKAVPALDATAYLAAGFLQSEDAPLLPGEVALARDGVFVGKARLRFTPTGERVDLGFGADDRVKVERVPVKRQGSDPVWGATRSQLVDMKTTVTNLHTTPVQVVILDRVPVSENAAIAVDILNPTTPTSERPGETQRGIMLWRLELKPNEARDIRLAYRMKWPSERELMFQDGASPMR